MFKRITRFFSGLDPRKLVVFAFVLLIAVVVGVYKRQDAARRDGTRLKYATAYAHYGIAASQREDSTLRTQAFDSISREIGVSPKQLARYTDGLVGNEQELALFWEDAHRMSDSLAPLALKNLRRR